MAQIVGKLVSSFPGVLFGPLYYRSLENDKTIALTKNCGNFDAHMHLSVQAVAELNWWSANILATFKPISHGQPSMVITTDASKNGWGAACDGVSTGGYGPIRRLVSILTIWNCLLPFWASKHSPNHRTTLTSAS